MEEYYARSLGFALLTIGLLLLVLSGTLPLASAIDGMIPALLTPHKQRLIAPMY